MKSKFFMVESYSKSSSMFSNNPGFSPLDASRSPAFIFSIRNICRLWQVLSVGEGKYLNTQLRTIKLE